MNAQPPRSQKSPIKAEDIPQESQKRSIKLNTSGIETELRKDYLHSYMVIIAPKRGKRPYDIKNTCQTLIETQSSPHLENNAELYSLLDQSGNWSTKVVDNGFPSLELSNPKAYGKQELVIDTPLANTQFGSLSSEQINSVLLTFQQRIGDLCSIAGIEYVLVFKNEGYESGASLAHSHTQIFALPFVPEKFAIEAKNATQYFQKNKKDPYQEIILFEQAQDSRIVHSGPHFIAFCPYASQWPFELLILPNENITNFVDCSVELLQELSKLLKNTTHKLNQHEISYNFYIENGLHENQRLQIRICGRSNVWGGFEVATGIVINTVPPESAAEWYRS